MSSMSALELSYGINNEAQNLSSAVTIAYDTKFGRHLLANKNIKPGDVLILEDAFAAVVDPKFYPQYCSFCFKRILSGKISCQSCEGVKYCSEICKKVGWKQWHEEECNVLKNFTSIWPDINRNEVHLIRIISIIGLSNLENYFESHLYSDKRIAGFVQGEFNSVSAKSILSLESNYNVRSLDDIEDAENFANDLLKYYNKKRDYISTENIKKIFFIRNSNTHALVEINDDLNTIEMGSGLYAVSSLVNHSCDPNMFRINIGKCLVHIASRPIETNEQLTISYGVTFQTKIKEERSSYLEKYHFICNCIACDKNWPLINKFAKVPENINDLRLQTLIEKLYHSTATTENINDFREIISLLYETNNFKCQLFFDFENRLKKYYRVCRIKTYVR